MSLLPTFKSRWRPGLDAAVPRVATHPRLPTIARAPRLQHGRSHRPASMTVYISNLQVPNPSGRTPAAVVPPLATTTVSPAVSVAITPRSTHSPDSHRRMFKEHYSPAQPAPTSQTVRPNVVKQSSLASGPGATERLFASALPVAGLRTRPASKTVSLPSASRVAVSQIASGFRSNRAWALSETAYPSSKPNRSLTVIASSRGQAPRQAQHWAPLPPSRATFQDAAGTAVMALPTAAKQTASSVPDVAGLDTMDQAEIHLDGQILGQWVLSHIEDALTQPQTGPSFISRRNATAWSGRSIF